VLACAAPAAARADGDPASDILVSEDVYYGYGIDLRSKAAAQLPALLQESRERGYELKVALISDYRDLGVMTHLWNNPGEYAASLGAELLEIYSGHLLIVMPRGFSIYFNGGVPGRERRALSRLKPPRRTKDFLAATITAARALAAANGVKLRVPDVSPPPGGVRQGPVHTPPPYEPRFAPTATATPAPAETSSRAWLFLAPVALFAGVAAVAAARARRRG